MHRLASNTMSEQKQATVRKDLDGIRNQLDQLLASNKKVYDQFAEKLDEQEHATLQMVFQEAEEACRLEDKQKIKSSLEAMQKASSILTQAMLRSDASM